MRFPTGAGRRRRRFAPRLRALVLMAAATFMVLAVGATAWALLQSHRSLERAVVERSRTLSRLLAKEVDRQLGGIDLLLQDLDEPLLGTLRRDTAGLGPLLDAGLRRHGLLRELAVVSAEGRVIASSNARSVGRDVSGLDFLVEPRIRPLHVGRAKSGRNLGGKVEEGDAHARAGFITLTHALPGDGAGWLLVAVVGSDSLLNDLRFVAADDDETFSLFRYDGSLLATSDEATASRTRPHPIFTDFLPDRETGGFTDRDESGARWLVRFDTADEQPVVVEVRVPAALVMARWQGEALPLLGVMAAILAGLLLYTRTTLRALDARDRSERALRHSRDAAEAGAKAKSSFLAMMSHELRTPMTGVLGMADLLAETPLTPPQKQYVTVLRNSAQSLLGVLNDVLDFSKIEAGRLQMEHIAFDPAAVFRDVVALLKPAASERGNTLELRLPAEALPVLRGDPTRLRQVLFNLVGNAVKFTERGRVTVSVTLRVLGPETRLLEVDVSDTGIGIAPEVMSRLFRPFEQADGETTRRFGGTGLGLAICQQLVQAMGGRIEVRSMPGQGSTFGFRLRLDLAHEAPAVEAPTPAAGTPARPLHVLLADDNATNRMLIGTRLEQMGHRVHVVEDGRQALQAAGDNAFDLVLMDMQMPELDGAAATQAIRALPGERGRVPIIALTADALPEFRERYMRSGLTDYLTKPIDWTALQATMARHAPTGVAPAVVTQPPAETPLSGLLALRATLGEARFTRLLAIFETSAAQDLARCREAVAGEDAQARRAAAHSLKGAAASMQLEALRTAAGRLELCPEADAPDALAMLEVELEAVRTALAGQRGAA